MFKNKQFKKAFTLVELLIVIIIIGILMAALLPKLTWAQAGARDTARKLDTANISTALAMYFNTESVYPTWHCASKLSDDLKSYMRQIPKDPQWKRITYWTKANWCTGWSYGYSALMSNWWDNGSSVVVADVETWGKNPNWVLTWYKNYKTTVQFDTGKEINDLLNYKCTSVIKSTDYSSGTCDLNNQKWATKDQNQMVFVVFN